MVVGQTLAELATQIRHERDAKHDFRAPTTRLHYTDDHRVEWKVGKTEYDATPTRYCHRQICERANIPVKYADRMVGEHAPLLATNVNWWWKNAPEKRMLRTLMNGDNIARAFVSESYRPLDNYDLAEVVLPKLTDAGCEVKSCQITETRLYIQAVTPRIELDLNALRARHVRLDEIDPVQAGIVISNSEVGAGSLALDQLIWRLSCLNGLIGSRVMRRHHIGRRSDPLFEMEEAAEYFSDATKEMDDRAFWNKVRDVVDAMMDPGKFETLCQKFADSASVKISATEAIEEITKRFQLVEDEQTSVLNHLIEGGELNVFGLANAVTRTSSDLANYDRAVELERIGGEIIELPKSTWELN